MDWTGAIGTGVGGDGGHCGERERSLGSGRLRMWAAGEEIEEGKGQEESGFEKVGGKKVKVMVVHAGEGQQEIAGLKEVRVEHHELMASKGKWVVASLAGEGDTLACKRGRQMIEKQ
ncbi:unnamed protein product [Linum trigynum]|uniref:Uncharacterized protein n=1 Tax=Linum trigynum TaxID=586398 RepID=A0AAV2FWN6_9ROSI